MTSDEAIPTKPPPFDEAFRVNLDRLLAWRRDVRRFRTDPVDETLLNDLLRRSVLAPSVGNSQPWRWVRVESATARAAVRASFESCNREALASYSGDRASIYARLKLAGLNDAPVHLAVFCDEKTSLGHGLGRRTMPQMLAYSVVSAVTNFWLAARAHGLGVGWVSILDPEDVHAALDVDSDWKLIAYLCVGYPVEEHEDPELVRAGWQERTNPADHILIR